MKRTEKGIACPNCGRVDMLATYRKRQIVEYRNISTEKMPIGGVYGYKANWLKESAKLIGKEGIRCMACQKDLEHSDFSGIGEIKISSKGALFVNDFFERFTTENKKD
tara:strand:+ start:864 stop:1187 length:324 start_codon:yes stop_codon:yes gene_type:complete